MAKPRWKLWLAGFVLLAAALFAGYTWLALNWSYSTGERAGYVQKFSRKGWLCKTWEGELAIVALPGSMPEIFRFSVRDDAVAAAINAQMGKRVSLDYSQHLGIPSTCFGETEYFVEQIRAVE
ncbi:MAG: hypothetical protein HGA47_14080 [Zoogloea sp.]|nr:hypothetical protein [Zoogloea sp.]